MKKLRAERLIEVGIELLCAAGVEKADAALVSGELVDTSLRGIDSHGIIRIVQYLSDIKSGLAVPGNRPKVVRETETTAVVDCRHNLGIVTGHLMVEIAARKAHAQGMSCVISIHGNHVGRLGAYVQKLAEAGLVALATVNSSRHGHFVAPWGGAEGRLATNPFAFGSPKKNVPIVIDMSTAMISEGKIRSTLHEGGELPPGRIQDAEGNSTTRPNDFYGPPRGTILPFGMDMGYKGFGLSLMVEILSSTLAGVALTAEGQKDDYVNGLCLLAIDPECFGSLGGFLEHVELLTKYLKSTKPSPGFSEILLPGEFELRQIEQRKSDGIPVAEQTWVQLAEKAAEYGIALERYDEL